METMGETINVLKVETFHKITPKVGFVLSPICVHDRSPDTKENMKENML